ncbi:MAG: hypothetical protein RL722_1478, partial [Pseudomonadota bacterium]
MVSVRNSMASTTSAAGGRAGTGSASPRTDNTLDPTAALPWLHEPLARALGQRRGHALLVHGPEGVGQFEFALALAQAWLCEAA